jgi:serine/threonine-protein kinase RsbW
MRKPIVEENRIKIPSSQDYLPDVDNFVEGKLKKLGIEKSTIADIAISVTEMVINCIVHGNKSDTSKIVTIELGRHDSEVEIFITDEGSGFNPGEVESPIDEKNLLKEVGRGIFITKSLMDSVDFEMLPGGGSRVTLKKKV